MTGNQLSRYGAISRMLEMTPGKVFFVKQSADTDFSEFNNEFPADQDGIPRVYTTIQGAVTAAATYGSPCKIYVFSGEMAAGATDPVSYTENVIIPATAAGIEIIGMGHRTQGGLPQLKTGTATTTALLTVRAPGVRIANIGFNGVGATGGGILLDDDGSTKSAFGTTIENCHFKNCVGSTATNAATGGAIQWASTGGAWQVRILNNRFYKNVGDVVLKGTSVSVPQDVVIEGNVFGDADGTSTDCNLYLAAGSGMTGLVIRNNDFSIFPNLTSGVNKNYLVLTGCTGILSGNRFGSNGKTFGAAANVLVPATVLMAANYQEKSTSGSGEVFRT